MSLDEAGHLARLTEHSGQPVVYVNFLESAPWNFRLPDRTPRYRGVGLRLLQYAVSLSTDLGYDGRIGLISLPGAEAFYEQTCRMTGVGEDPRYNGLMAYEFTAASAARFLEDR